MSDQLNRQFEIAEQMNLLPLFRHASRSTGVPVSILLAVASRESNIGTSHLLIDWIGDHGWAYGIMQIDVRYHPNFTGRVAPDNHRENILYAANYLKRHYDAFGNWQHAAAAYNAGAGNVRSALSAGTNPDYRTTGNNYGADVMNRANYFRSLVGEEPSQLYKMAALYAGVGAIILTYHYYNNK